MDGKGMNEWGKMGITMGIGMGVGMGGWGSTRNPHSFNSIPQSYLQVVLDY
jgi:hypothetical protein